jgi:hypothetical protein
MICIVYYQKTRKNKTPHPYTPLQRFETDEDAVPWLIVEDGEEEEVVWEASNAV